MTIRLLDDNLINKIAAGEVIERPASIVKELVENSIDAGARKISIKISGGGIEKIEVEDDGQGLDYDEVPLAFLRHATSKINQEEDLQNILTMGFRGEALPSIASVSRIKMYGKSRDKSGVFAALEGGQLIEHQINASPPGTRIVVKDLFYNTPARKKFLKTTVTESNHINELMCKYALARPDISFSYSSEKKNYFKTPGNNCLLDTVTAVYGRDFTDHLMEVSYSGDVYEVYGLISKPDIKRVNRKNQLFFINNRPIRSPILYRAVDTAYQGRLLSREHPVVILSVKLDPAIVDVNVHPQKSEIRFKDEQGIFRVVYDVIRERLDKSNFGMNINYFKNERHYESDNNIYTTKFQGLIKQEPIFGTVAVENAGQDRSYESVLDTTCLPEDILCESDAVESRGDFKIIGQLFNTYILLEKDDSFWIADQHAAHERIIFSRLLDEHARSAGSIQDLIIPITLELSGKQMDAVETNTDRLCSMGFNLQVIGHNSVAVRSVPAALAGKEKEVLYEILDELEQDNIPDLNRRIVTIMSCKKAVKAGNVLSEDEMARIINDLFTLKDYQHCPHGRPTIIRLDYQDLERMFKRI